ncbi:sodium:alanine symporter family protein [Lipingzhangella sp. LS1_29]|uniref:Sodium:alanine symporter family protein n=1 Tax=Lipingzhangella rawalii TaxID=2055835 RepID=A0ABU2H6Q0_9ACTN|nr:sodium:alanine symporter family protein [Lipingzhangella rawalii]MDS1270983.1 sodium:alanine symporter family protein [Lipingzhangella rawalii]
MEQLGDILDLLSGIIWGPWVLIPLLLATGVFLTARLKALQLWTLPHALWLALIRRKEHDETEGDISHYQALSTALAATIGIGNIGGVASAIAIGGPGALFWMWVTGLLGMATKYSEALLGVKYRERDAKGQQSGGPMFYLKNGIEGNLGLILGGAFAVFGAIAAFGIGNGLQAGQASGQLEDTWGVPQWLTGVLLVVAAGAVILGGIKSIGRAAAAIVPFMALVYIFSAIFVLIVFVGDLPAALAQVFSDAFTGNALVGGTTGAAIMIALQMGLARGIFSNESGLGTGAIAAAAAKTTQPVRQAMVSMTQTFIDTLIVVTLTGLTLIVTGVWEAGEDGYEADVLMTSAAFDQGLPLEIMGIGLGTHVITFSVLIFAFTTMLGWSYYGERCMDFLFGRGAVVPYRVVFVGLIFVGATVPLDLLWTFSDIFNGLMALPNLLGLLLLSPVIVAETRRYFNNPQWKNPDLKIPDVRE